MKLEKNQNTLKRRSTSTVSPEIPVEPDEEDAEEDEEDVEVGLFCFFLLK